MKRKTISIILALVLCTAAFALPVSGSENALSKEAKIAFGTFIQTIPEASSFGIVDMNASGEEEVIVMSDYQGGTIFLLYFNGSSVVSYEFDFRAMMNLKTDGTFLGSSGAESTSYHRFKAGTANFTSENEVTLAYSEGSDTSDGSEVHYWIDNKEVSESRFNVWENEREARDDVKWIDCNANNIRTAFLSDEK
jgi:hypothetical protein